MFEISNRQNRKLLGLENIDKAKRDNDGYRSLSGALPSMVADFERQTYLLGSPLATTTFPSLVTTTRAGTATYFGSDGLLKTAAVDEPRFEHDPLTRRRKGLLVEGASTNIMFPSKPASPWTTVNGLLTPNIGAGIDGVPASIPLFEDTDVVNVGYQRRVLTIPADTATSYAYFVAKPTVGTVLSIRLAMTGGTAVFNGILSFDTATRTFISVPGGAVRWGAEELGNGKWLIWTSETNNGTNTQIDFRISPANIAAAADIGSWEIDFAQVSTEPPSSYIPTTGSAVTRVADSYTFNDLTWLDTVNPIQGTVFGTGIMPALTPGDVGVLLTAGDTNNRIEIRATSTGGVTGIIVAGGVTQATITMAAGLAVGNRFTLALSFQTDRVRLACNGTLSALDTAAAMPIVTASARVGNRVTSGTHFNGPIGRVGYFPTPLSDADLADLSNRWLT
jgi:hypothetical protein